MGRRADRGRRADLRARGDGSCTSWAISSARTTRPRRGDGRLRAGRARRIEAMAERLRDLGLSVDLEAVRRAFPRAVLGRRHLAEYLARTGQVSGVRAAFAQFLGDDGPGHRRKDPAGCDRAIGLISGAGGVAALAHPPHDFGESAIRVPGRRRACGPSRWTAPAAPAAWAVGSRIADRLGLVGVAGSDFHAADRPGRWVGAVTTDRRPRSPPGRGGLGRRREAARAGCRSLARKPRRIAGRRIE